MSARLGCFGDPLARTPNIDNLASEGIRFTRAFSVSGVCGPSRAALITGMYPVSFGAQHMRTLSRTASLDMITDPELVEITGNCTPGRFLMKGLIPLRQRQSG
jgi:N-sulfoglucosamine sulfohydrolase